MDDTLNPHGPPHLFGAVKGDELLVDGSAYTGAGEEWAPLVRVAPGSAAVYPYKVRLSNGAEGQYAAREILAVRRPLPLHRTLREIELLHPGQIATLARDCVCPR